MERFLSKCLFETAHNAFNSMDMVALKFRLVQYDTFYNDQSQQDSSECLVMLIEGINKGSAPYWGSNNNYSPGVSLSNILFSFMLEKYIICDICGLKSLSFESSNVLYNTHTYTSSTQKLIMQRTQQALEKYAFDVKKKTWHV